jgi:serine/threonine protein kinase
VWTGDCGPKCDIWSAGCVMYQLFARRLPFKPPPGVDSTPQVWRTLHRAGCNFDAMKASRECVHLCRQLLQVKEKARPTARPCLDHPWFAKCGQDSMFTKQFSNLQNVCLSACRWPELHPMQRAICLKMAADRAGISRFAGLFLHFDK